MMQIYDEVLDSRFKPWYDGRVLTFCIEIPDYAFWSRIIVMRETQRKKKEVTLSRYVCQMIQIGFSGEVAKYLMYVHKNKINA